jgi:hypothetical protein
MDKNGWRDIKPDCLSISSWLRYFIDEKETNLTIFVDRHNFVCLPGKCARNLLYANGN